MVFEIYLASATNPSVCDNRGEVHPYCRSVMIQVAIRESALVEVHVDFLIHAIYDLSILADIILAAESPNPLKPTDVSIKGEFGVVIIRRGLVKGARCAAPIRIIECATLAL